MWKKIKDLGIGLLSGGIHAISCALASSGFLDELDDIEDGITEAKRYVEPKVKKVFNKKIESEPVGDYQI